MNTYAKKPLQTACVNWLDNQITWDIALSLNFRAHITRDQAVRAAKQFWQRVDCAVYGSKVKRKGLRVPRVCVLEGDGHSRNYHYHAAVAVPEQQQPAEFQHFLLSSWQQFGEAGRYSHVEPCTNSQGWLDYICKDMNTSMDVLCVETSHIPV